MVKLFNIGKSSFGENDLSTPETPNDTRLAFDPVTWVEGPKRIHMYVSYCHAR